MGEDRRAQGPIAVGPTSGLRTTLKLASRCGVTVVGPTVTTREVGLSAVESWFSRDTEEGLRQGLGGRPQYGSVR